MNQSINRREFLKLSSLALLSLSAPNLANWRRAQLQAPPHPNILVIVFDAFSALDNSLYGYTRTTTPNLARIAERAIVYHNHYAGGHWTYPGTASLLTGVHPWTHRGFSEGQDIIAPYSQSNLFSLFDDYFRVAYTHNPKAEAVLKQFGAWIDNYVPVTSLYLTKSLFLERAFTDDYDMGSLTWVRFFNSNDDGYANSLLMSKFYPVYQNIRLRDVAHLFENYPGGPPRILRDSYFLLEDAIDWILDQANVLPQPYLGYFHLLPPHDVYAPRQEFYDVFENDGFSFPQKPLHFLKMEIEHEEQKRLRQRYDEYILNVDAEFARLYDHLYANGNLENTWLILTSDHGEMFERGIRAHGRPVFYEPIIKVPLLILPPKQTVRQDIYTPTSAIDLLPTLLHFAQKSAPETLTGQLLPPFNNAEPEESRSIYAVAAGQKDPLSALSRATIMLLKDNYKMIYYFGYENMPGSDPYYELFNLVADPDEMVNLAGTKPQLEKDMFSELVASLHQNDKFPASN